jgi:predicted dehydrogenase
MGGKTEINIGMLGYGFMGKAHSHAYSVLSHMFADLDMKPVLYAVAGQKEEELKRFADRFGYKYCSTDWRKIAQDPKIDIINVCLPESLHEEACLLALEARKHVLCEKPLALSVSSCQNIVQKASEVRSKTMCGFNYRFLPAIRLAKEILQEGFLKQVYFMAGNYCQETGHDPHRPAEQVRYAYGSDPLGSIRGIGSHLIDMARFLMGEILSVNALLRTFTKVRQTSTGEKYTVQADDVSTMIVEFSSGAAGSLTASAVSTGRKNQLGFEINGSGGSICFDLEHPNDLSVYLDDVPNPRLRGFSQVNVTDKNHSLMSGWWPPGHNLGWEHGHINQLKYFLECICGDREIAPFGATFIDGLKAAEVAEYACLSSKEGRKRKIGEK